MNRIRISVSAKVMVLSECVKLAPSTSYSDGIIKGFEYTGQSQQAVTIVNYCNQPFTVGQINLFSDNSNGGNFAARLNGFTIGANQTLNIPVYYYGIYLGSNLSPNYTISLNGNTSVYSLTVTVPVVNRPPVVTDIFIERQNRQAYTFTVDDFLNHFTDLDGDSLDAVSIEGDVTGFLLSGSPYVAATWIPKSQINSGLLQFVPTNTDAYTEKTVTWKARDTAGSVSN